MSISPYTDHPTPPDEMPLRYYLDVVRRRKAAFLLTFVLVAALGIAATLLMPSLYRVSTKLLAPARPAASLGPIDPTDPLAELLVPTQPVGAEAQRDQLLAPSFLEQAMTEVGVDVRTPGPKPSVKVTAPEETGVITIAVESEDANVALRLARTLAGRHLARLHDHQMEGLQRAIRYVVREKRKAARELEAAEARLGGFLRSHPAEEAAARRTADAARRVELQARVTEARGRSDSAAAELKELRRRLEREPRDVLVERMEENPVRRQISTRLQELQVSRVGLLRDYVPTSHAVQDVDRQIEDYTRQYEAEPTALAVRAYVPNPRREQLERQVAEAEAAALRNREEHRVAVAARQRWERQNGSLPDPAVWSVQRDALTEQRNQARERFSMLEDRQSRLEMRRSAQALTTRIIDPGAIPTLPSWPPRAACLVLAVVGALLLGLGAAFLQEHLDDRVRSASDLGAHELSLLGLLPGGRAGAGGLVVTDPEMTSVAEAYRGIRAGIGFAAGEVPLRRLLVAGVSRDHRGRIALNLAATAALEGRRVILVDANLREPGLHSLLDLHHAPGLTEVLEGKLPLAEVLQRTGVDNLWLLSSGWAPAHPARLLGSEALERLLTELEERADEVVVNVPGCLRSTDAQVLAGRMDGVLLVVEAGENRRGEIRQAVDLLCRAHARLLGLVLDGAAAGWTGAYYPPGGSRPSSGVVRYSGNGGGGSRSGPRAACDAGSATRTGAPGDGNPPDGPW